MSVSLDGPPQDDIEIESNQVPIDEAIAGKKTKGSSDDKKGGSSSSDKKKTSRKKKKKELYDEKIDEVSDEDGDQ